MGTDIYCVLGKPSEVIYPPRMNPDGTRRPSVWSTPDGRRVTLMNLFSRKSTTVESPNGASGKESEEGRIEFNDADLPAKKKVEVE